MKYYIILLVLTTLSCSCKCQKKNQGNADFGIDPVTDQPFSIVRKDMLLKLPDSIRGKENKGQFITQLKLDTAGKIKSYDLLKLFYKRDGIVVCDLSKLPGDSEFVGKVDHSVLMKMSPIIEKYLFHAIEIKKNKNQKIDSINILRFNTLFN